ncbi:hypothetical protein EC991_003894 [Linnemannia zychae]|nr:hypothetical protein EC991_003894 [Linnemannia zychae]
MDGSLLSIKEFGNILSPTRQESLASICNCEFKELHLYTEMSGPQKFVSSSGSVFTTKTIKSDLFYTLVVTTRNLSRPLARTKSMSIQFPLSFRRYHISFLPNTSHLLLAHGHLLVWSLSATSIPFCTLSLVWKLYANDVHREPISAKACEHGKSIRIRAAFYLQYGEYSKEHEFVTVPISSREPNKTTEQDHLIQRVLHLIYIFDYGDENVKKDIIRYLRARIRPSTKHPESCLVTLCRAWSQENKTKLEQLVDNLLPSNSITWVPEVHKANLATPEDVQDPLLILIKTAKTQHHAIGVARIIMDYCVNHARRSNNLAFLAPLFHCMNDLMKFFPDDAFKCLGRIAYIQVKQRSYIIDNHILVHPPNFRLKFWKPTCRSLTSFEALWRSDSDISGQSTSTVVVSPETTSWWWTIFHMIRFRFRLKNPVFVECHRFSTEFFDNPAIAALVAYKWNTIGYTYWVIRFFFQCCYYSLVLVSAVLQIYHNDPRLLQGLFIAITSFAMIFLFLEFREAQNWEYYQRYNVLNFLAFCIPMGASIDQLVIILKKGLSGNVRSLSFSVLIVFMHMLFELRINKSVCKYVIIIQQAFVEIQVFFVIFAAGILVFTLAFVHMLHACPYGDCEQDPNATFPINFFGAVSATYFFMDWAVHVMMIIFFFFTVILLLNVLIALINKAHTKSDDDWRLVWIESRLRYIEAAENMSHLIPGFRETYNWFPKEIYFTAKIQQVKEYCAAYHPEDMDDIDYKSNREGNGKTATSGGNGDVFGTLESTRDNEDETEDEDEDETEEEDEDETEDEDEDEDETEDER